MADPALDDPDDAGLPRPLPPVPWPQRVADTVRVHAEQPARLAALVLAVAGAAAVGWWLWSAGRPPPPPPELSLPMASAAGAGEPGSAPAGPGGTAKVDVVAHAAGAVARPGLYTLPAGSRVADLLAAAGGPAADADVDRINLAAPVLDGQRVYVPKRGEAVPPDPVAGGSATAGPSQPVDINTATLADLDGLPGIGPAIASAIIEHRERSGPFRSVEQLLEVPGIGEAKLATLRPLVRV